MLRRVLWLVIIVVAVWSGGWWLAAAELGRALATDEIAASGWSVRSGEADVSGYPLRFNVHLNDISAQGPRNERVALDSLDASAPAFWPGNATIALPETPVLIAFPSTDIALQIEAGEARMHLGPSLALPLRELGIEGSSLDLNVADARWGSNGPFHLSLRQTDDNPALYDLSANVAEMAPGAPLRRLLNVPAQWGETLYPIVVEGAVGFDAPLDRASLSGPLPQLRILRLHQATAGWGDVEFSAEGDLTFDLGGVPTGSVTVSTSGWRSLLDMAIASGLLQPDARRQIETVLGAMARISGTEEEIIFPLRFADDQMWLGGIVLGPAPRLR